MRKALTLTYSDTLPEQDLRVLMLAGSHTPIATIVEDVIAAHSDRRPTGQAFSYGTDWLVRNPDWYQYTVAGLKWYYELLTELPCFDTAEVAKAFMATQDRKVWRQAYLLALWMRYGLEACEGWTLAHNEWRGWYDLGGLIATYLTSSLAHPDDIAYFVARNAEGARDACGALIEDYRRPRFGDVRRHCQQIIRQQELAAA